ncbi:hypothetical protein KEM48_003306 [Puccinia striiformis f. sp. tritici PST-130]|nr:hypothetical protein KEM48_003306 [Puccinia striiformis f. sp. tritici PST-130]
MEKIHRAAIVYCIKLVMGTDKANTTKELPLLPSERIRDIVDQTYLRFFSPQAKASAADDGRSKKTLKEKYLSPGSKLNHLRPSTIGVADPIDPLNTNDVAEDVSEAGDNEPDVDENKHETSDDNDSSSESEEM